MRPLPRRTLKRIFDRYGPELVDDPRRTEALLNDLCPDYRREIFVLVNAQRQQVPAELLAAPRWMPRHALHTRLVRRLQDKLSLTEDAAAWAVDAWSFALGKTPDTPSARSPLFPRRKPASVSPPTSTDDGASALPAGNATSSPAADPSTPASPPGERIATRTHAPRHTSPLRRFLESPLMWVAAVSVAVIAAILVIDGSLFTPSLATSSPASAPPLLGYAGAAQPGALLAHIYPLPRTAWVNVEGLNVRSGPSLDNEALTKLAFGYTVTVDDFSADGAWSHINGTNVGWVSNQYLNFIAEGDFPSATETMVAQPAVLLAVEELAVALPTTTLYTGPDLSFPVATTLPAETTVTAVAATLDGQWRHLALPAAGWVPATDLAP